jgi:hypothetical protein
VLGYGGYEKQKSILNKIIRYDTFMIGLQFLSFALARKTYMGTGRNLAYKKSLFFKMKGFASHYHIESGDDDLFVNKSANKKNVAVVIDKDAATLSIPRKTWKSWVKQKYRHYTTAKYYKPVHKFLLGLYTFSQFFFYPLFIMSIIFYDWRYALIGFGTRFIVQALIYFFAMKKLNEKDLWPMFLLLDIWMFFYYIIFARSLWQKPQRSWN